MGIIRQISPVLDARRLGYQPTLVAMRVEGAELAQAERIIRQHPGVSHGYERDHHFNLWFTLSVPPDVDIETELERMTGSIAAGSVLVLPAVKMFKIGSYFSIGENGQKTADIATHSGGAFPKKVALTPQDRLVIKELQQDLPLVSTPFNAMAARLGMDVEAFLSRCRSLLRRGVLRRFGASINHNRAGFKANAMTCWVVPPEKVHAVGQKLASLPEVSHCYERKTSPLWKYNLFAMVHCHTREACREVVASASKTIGLDDCVLLFSTREFKKTRIKYAL
jgi:DNA-binding Lrp family transcriptional regulator